MSRFSMIEVEMTATAGQDGFGQVPWMLEPQRPRPVRTDDSPWREKRANDAGTQRLTHMRWDNTADRWPHVALCGLNLAPGMAPMGCSRSSIYFSELEPRYGIKP
jgi:hypothetical protein